MKWSHLPMDGGLFNQKPELLDRFMDIFQAQAEQERREEAERKRKTPQSAKGGRTMRGAH